MRMEGLKGGTKKRRDYSKYLAAGGIGAGLLLAIGWLEHFGVLELLLITLFVAGFYLYMQKLETEKEQGGADGKDELLRFKYRDEVIVHKLKRGMIWKGESAEQLVDSLGVPQSIKPLNGRDTSNAIWVYDGRVAYERSEENGKKIVFEAGLRIEVRAGVVAGWERKKAGDAA